jgi:hypothetical protein
VARFRSRTAHASALRSFSALVDTNSSTIYKKIDKGVSPQDKSHDGQPIRAFVAPP